LAEKRRTARPAGRLPSTMPVAKNAASAPISRLVKCAKASWSGVTLSDEPYATPQRKIVA